MWGATRKLVKNDDGFEISIHAPRVGSDIYAHSVLRLDFHFNPRSPCGERPAQYHPLTDIVLFQSTLPVWGATPLLVLLRTLPLISIHAPRVGSDCSREGKLKRLKNFNPRSPCGERQLAVTPISIHAPRVGSDKNLWEKSSTLCNFNPRSPCGERQHNILP